MIGDFLIISVSCICIFLGALFEGIKKRPVTAAIRRGFARVAFCAENGRIRLGCAGLGQESVFCKLYKM